MFLHSRPVHKSTNDLKWTETMMYELWITYFFWQRRHCIYKQFIIPHCLELIKWLHKKGAQYRVSTFSPAKISNFSCQGDQKSSSQRRLELLHTSHCIDILMCSGPYAETILCCHVAAVADLEGARCEWLAGSGGATHILSAPSTPFSTIV